MLHACVPEHRVQSSTWRHHPPCSPVGGMEGRDRRQRTAAIPTPDSGTAELRGSGQPQPHCSMSPWVTREKGNTEVCGVTPSETPGVG